eukprot:COSAG01_NODE_9101_length_2554_cov_139.263544_4_plen_56_part_00
MQKIMAIVRNLCSKMLCDLFDDGDCEVGIILMVRPSKCFHDVCLTNRLLRMRRNC